MSAASYFLGELREEQRPKRSSTLYRSVTAESYTLSSNGSSSGDGKTLTGRFAVYDVWSEINSSVEGHFMERIAPGAFRKTLRERGKRIPIMFSHGRDPQIGEMTLGRVRDLHEDAEGVSYSVELFDGIPPLLLAGLKAGSYGASFRAKLIQDHFDPNPRKSRHNPRGLPESVVTELSLREFGPTPVPAYETTTAEVRSVTDVYVPQVRVATDLRTARPESRPSWLLGDGEELPYWQLTNRKDRHALASTRTT